MGREKNKVAIVTNHNGALDASRCIILVRMRYFGAIWGGHACLALCAVVVYSD